MSCSKEWLVAPFSTHYPSFAACVEAPDYGSLATAIQKVSFYSTIGHLLRCDSWPFVLCQFLRLTLSRYGTSSQWCLSPIRCSVRWCRNLQKNDAELPLYRQFRILILIEKDSHRAVLINWNAFLYWYFWTDSPPNRYWAGYSRLALVMLFNTSSTYLRDSHLAIGKSWSK